MATKTSDLRQEIALQVGRRTNPDTPLEKRVLNSVHAYLTGEFYYKPAVRDRPAENDHKSRDNVLVAVVFRGGIGEPGDKWSTDPPEYLTKKELKELLQTLREREDKRRWIDG
jgi:hypothetical protein